MGFDLIDYLTVKRDKGILVWILNMGIENIWYPDSRGFTVTDRKEDELLQKMSEITLLLTRKQDYLILKDEPDSNYLNIMRCNGFDIPNFLYAKDRENIETISELVLFDEELINKLKRLGEQDEVFFLPYGISKLEENIAEICKLRLIGSSSEINKLINNKIYSRFIAEKLGFKLPEGIVCSSLEEIETAYKDLKGRSQKLVIKNSVGASGKGIYIINNDKDFKTTILILKRLLRQGKYFRCVVEKWHEKKSDINYQINIANNGKVTVFSIKEQVIYGAVYLGSFMPARISEDLYNQYIEYGEIIGNYLYKQGYVGILGIDSIITIDDEIIPIIEINARFTLSTYLSFLDVKYPGKFIYSFYEKVKLSDSLNFNKLTDYLRNEKLDFNSETFTGIIVYISAALKESVTNKRGRLFLIIVSSNMEDFIVYKEKVQMFLEPSNQSVSLVNFI